MKTLLSMTLALLVALTMRAVETPTMGWSSWNTYRNNISADLIKSQAAAIVANGLKDAGYLYVNIDDGAFNGRDAEGRLMINLTRFPDGMKPVVDYIHSLGLKAGTYSDAGRNTCASYYDNDTGGVGTGLYTHDREDMAYLFNDLGFDFIKVDFCGGDPGQNSEHLDLDERERYTAIGEAIKATGRDDVRYNICRWNYPGTWVGDVASSWRTTWDIYPEWDAVMNIIAQNLYLSAYAGGGAFNDMDMLEVGRGMSDEEDKTHFGMWCIMSSPLLIGCDLTAISPATLELLTNSELVALNQDPLGLQAYVVSQEAGAYTLVKDVETLHGTTRAVALYNPTDSERTMTLSFADIDLGGEVKVRDLFGRVDMGPMMESMTITVPAHGTRIYRLDGAERHERQLYEAETGWITAYQELENNQTARSGIYEEDPELSGGAKATWLGMRPDNDLQWRDVYSRQGGEYRLTIACISDEDRTFDVEVNDTTIGTVTANSGSATAPVTKTLDVKLNPGSNTIRLYTTTGRRMPDIDYMKVTPI
ncbi:MAG: alpha-galactosidase [Muribaculaceae bacterium]|nr:alpha-galactosidase [Muribaculaceae bacterium]